MGEIHQHRVTVHAVDIAPARVGCLRHGLETGPDVVRPDAKRPAEGRRAERVGNVVTRGTAKRDRWIVDQLGKHVDYQPICPEVAIGLGTPRPPIRLVGVGFLVSLILSILMQEFTASDSARVFYRWSGEDRYRHIPMLYIPHTRQSQYSAALPQPSLAPRGVDYFLTVYNGAVQASSDTLHLRHQVAALEVVMAAAEITG